MLLRFERFLLALEAELFDFAGVGFAEGDDLFAGDQVAAGDAGLKGVEIVEGDDVCG